MDPVTAEVLRDVAGMVCATVFAVVAFLAIFTDTFDRTRRR